MTNFVTTQREKLLPLRAQADLRNAWLRERLDTLLPELMAREGFDAWIVAAANIPWNEPCHIHGWHDC